MCLQYVCKRCDKYLSGAVEGKRAYKPCKERPRNGFIPFGERRCVKLELCRGKAMNATVFCHESRKLEKSLGAAEAAPDPNKLFTRPGTAIMVTSKPHFATPKSHLVPVPRPNPTQLSISTRRSLPTDISLIDTRLLNPAPLLSQSILNDSPFVIIDLVVDEQRSRQQPPFLPEYIELS